MILLPRLGHTALQAYGMLPNTYMKDVFLGRRTALVPNSTGIIEGVGKQKIAILLLGAKSNHPLGFFAPEFMATFEWMSKINASFDKQDAPPGCKIPLP